MEFIIEFYKELDTLNLIIFWGTIIVIILLLIFSLLLMSKNKKLKNLVEEQNKYEEDLPIKQEKQLPVEEFELPVQENTMPIVIEKAKENIDEPIETEQKFVAEEHVIGYNTNNDVEEQKENKNPTFEMPTAPYQRNVLREMSLSQTSPIGITKPNENHNKKLEMVKDLEESLNNDYMDLYEPKKNVVTETDSNTLERSIQEESVKEVSLLEKLPNQKSYLESSKMTTLTYNSEQQAKEILESQPKISEPSPKNNSSGQYLEEVSRKLSEAEIPNEIERTNYELKQEEDAIISYKELMEKKDTIQTIDEEDAVISIEELMNRNNSKDKTVEDQTKLYNLTEEEENDNFIKELKQFRNDL